jgi:hypothetical protein
VLRVATVLKGLVFAALVLLVLTVDYSSGKAATAGAALTFVAIVALLSAGVVALALRVVRKARRARFVKPS